jgi:phosphoenolpyruvate carboxykinase (GTP)
VLQWVIGRCEGKAKAVTTPIGLMPAQDAIDTAGLDLPPGAMDRLLEVDHEGWARALRGQEEFFDQFGGRLPQEMRQENEALRQRLKSAR